MLNKAAVIQLIADIIIMGFQGLSQQFVNIFKNILWIASMFSFSKILSCVLLLFIQVFFGVLKCGVTVVFLKPNIWR